VRKCEAIEDVRSVNLMNKSVEESFHSSSIITNKTGRQCKNVCSNILILIAENLNNSLPGGFRKNIVVFE
jgi:hypothetical protein